MIPRALCPPRVYIMDENSNPCPGCNEITSGKGKKGSDEQQLEKEECTFDIRGTQNSNTGACTDLDHTPGAWYCREGKRISRGFEIQHAE